MHQLQYFPGAVATMQRSATYGTVECSTINHFNWSVFI